MSIDEPIDLEAVALDDAVVERLRSSLSPDAAVVWDDDDSEDLSYALLRALQNDVSAELPAPPAPTADVVPLAGRRRGLGRSATVAAVTAGVLSLAGAAAAASSSPGDALYGVRSAVATAVQDVVDAITPARPVGPAPQVMAATPTATITPRGQDVSALARSLSAIRQIEDRLTLAESHLDEGRFRPAIQLLDQAESRFEQVLDLTVRAGLANRVEELRDRAAAMSAAAPTHKPTPSATEKAKPKPEAKRATPRPSRSAAAQRGSEAKPAAGGENVRGGESPRTIPSLPSRAQDARDRTGPSLRER